MENFNRIPNNVCNEIFIFQEFSLSACSYTFRTWKITRALKVARIESTTNDQSDTIIKLERGDRHIAVMQHCKQRGKNHRAKE